MPGPTAALYIAALLKIQEVARSLQVYALSRIRIETRNQRIDAALFREPLAYLDGVILRMAEAFSSSRGHIKQGGRPSGLNQS